MDLRINSDISPLSEWHFFLTLTESKSTRDFSVFVKWSGFWSFVFFGLNENGICYPSTSSKIWGSLVNFFQFFRKYFNLLTTGRPDICSSGNRVCTRGCTCLKSYLTGTFSDRALVFLPLWDAKFWQRTLTKELVIMIFP